MFLQVPRSCGCDKLPPSPHLVPVFMRNRVQSSLTQGDRISICISGLRFTVASRGSCVRPELITCKHLQVGGLHHGCKKDTNLTMGAHLLHRLKMKILQSWSVNSCEQVCSKLEPDKNCTSSDARHAVTMQAVIIRAWAALHASARDVQVYLADGIFQSGDSTW